MGEEGEWEGEGEGKKCLYRQKLRTVLGTVEEKVVDIIICRFWERKRDKYESCSAMSL